MLLKGIEMSKVMQGFPPKEPNQATLDNWRKAPYCHWAFHHVRELVPSAEIQNNPMNVWELESGTFDTCLLYTSPSPRDS